MRCQDHRVVEGHVEGGDGRAVPGDVLEPVDRVLAPRRPAAVDAFVRQGRRGALDLSSLRPLEELILGGIGGGRIGSAFTERMLPSVADVLVYDPGVEAVPKGARLVPVLTSHRAAGSDRSARRPAAWTIGDAADRLLRRRVEHGELVYSVV